MKKILTVLAAAVTIISCSEADKTAETNSSGTAATTEATSTETAVAATTTTNTAAQQTAVDPAPLSKIEWLDGVDKDFGKMKEGDNLEVSFRFKNVGDKPLIISNVTAACGCTVPEVPKEPFAPGQTGVIKASFNSSGKPGSQTKQVYVTANTDPAMTTLTFHTEVKAKS